MALILRGDGRDVTARNEPSSGRTFLVTERASDGASLDGPMLSDVQSYYRAALHALRFIEARTPTGRRFGDDADALWRSFKGHLETADRMDILLRDADAQWPEAFGARTVFGVKAAAEDDPFGSEWASLDPVDAEELWRGVLRETPPTSVADTLRSVATSWNLQLRPHAIDPIRPADKLLVCGPSAIAAAAEAFDTTPDLDWADQVVCVATPPSHRQLAALAGALLKIARPVPILTTPPPPGRRVIVSPDADPEDAARC